MSGAPKNHKAAPSTTKMKALVIDDEPRVRRFVAEVLSEEGWEVTESETAECAFEKMREGRWELVFCDVLLGGADGYAVLSRFTEKQPRARVVLMTGQGSAAGALGATAGGAYDYLMKPFGIPQVSALSAAVRGRLKRRPPPASEADMSSGAAHTLEGALVGRSRAFVEVMKLVGRVAPTNLPVLITGESGTGKEVVAERIHLHSSRANQPFVTVNCGALPAELIESELFGHVRGSFTGAERDRGGLFEEASGGTIFLDEITETPPAFQVKLLRALQKKEIRRVGSNQIIPVDVRVVAASNRDVEEEVRQGRFRQDLLYRLNTVTIDLPPLRERREDILPLAEHFAASFSRPGAPPVGFAREVVYLLETYPWPGNVRELQNAVARAASLCDHKVRPEDLPAPVRLCHSAEVDADSTQPEKGSGRTYEEWPSLSEIERRYVARVLSHTGGNKQAATRLLRIDRKTLDRMITRHKLVVGRTVKVLEGSAQTQTL